MFIYLFIFFLIFYKIEFTHLYICMYVLYIFTYNYYNFNIFYAFPKINYTTNIFFLVNIFLKRLTLILQISLLNIKIKPFWKPLFRKMSYFGFYRNSINNINKK